MFCFRRTVGGLAEHGVAGRFRLRFAERSPASDGVRVDRAHSEPQQSADVGESTSLPIHVPTREVRQCSSNCTYAEPCQGSCGMQFALYVHNKIECKKSCFNNMVRTALVEKSTE